jgi:hypothetical protein
VGAVDAFAPQVPPSHVAADPASAYGPDDPAYGPPAPGWQHQDQPAGPGQAPHVPAGEPSTDSVESAAARGAFESVRYPAQAADQDMTTPTVIRDPFQPLNRHGDVAADASDGSDVPADPWDGGYGVGGYPGQSPLEYPDRPPLEFHGEQPDYEFPGFAGDGFPGFTPDGADLPVGSASGAVGQLKGLYLAAEAARPESFDKHFDQLLDRQRKLISEYFKQSAGPGAAASQPSAPDSGRLAGLAGDRRNTR